MVPVGDFHIVYENTSVQGQQLFVLRPNASIVWPAGRKSPPRDSPKCGFHGELCKKPVKDGKCCDVVQKASTEKMVTEQTEKLEEPI